MKRWKTSGYNRGKRVISFSELMSRTPDRQHARYTRLYESLTFVQAAHFIEGHVLIHAERVGIREGCTSVIVE